MPHSWKYELVKTRDELLPRFKYVCTTCGALEDQLGGGWYHGTSPTPNSFVHVVDNTNGKYGTYQYTCEEYLFLNVHDS
jgi:hypothetical protein